MGTVDAEQPIGATGIERQLLNAIGSFVVGVVNLLVSYWMGYSGSPAFARAPK